jgi:hypothetical protein
MLLLLVDNSYGCFYSKSCCLVDDQTDARMSALAVMVETG